MNSSRVDLDLSPGRDGNPTAAAAARNGESPPGEPGGDAVTRIAPKDFQGYHFQIGHARNGFMIIWMFLEKMIKRFGQFIAWRAMQLIE